MRAALVALAVTLAACPSDPPGAGPDASGGRADATAPADAASSLDAALARPDAGPAADAAPAGRDAAAPGPDAATIVHECDPGAGWCTGALARHACADTASGRRWRDETCASGTGCVGGACVAGACTDECALGEVQSGKTCTLWDVAAGAAAAPAPAAKQRDRARAYEAWLRAHALTAGGVGSPYWTDATLSTVENMDGLGDSAIWTGTWLAAEALRLKATGEPDARATVKRIVGTLHDWLSVSGQPGMLARFAVRSDAHPAYVMGDLTGKCADRRVHCGVSYQGASWDYVGHISRDQYQGVMLGFALAYEALGPEDEPTRKLIRDDVVTFVKELMTERKVPMKITVNGIPFTINAAMRFVVLAPAEMNGGAVEFIVNTKSYDDAEMWGFQEFMPDLADLVRQVPGFSWSPSIPRASSAIMLASFFQVALAVTESVPASAADRAAILDYYLHHSGTGGNVDAWLDVALKWSANANCGANYYSNNITFEPLYNLGRLEADPARAQRVRVDLLRNTMWPSFAATKNVFFSFIDAALDPAPDPATVPAALAQLAQFPPPPRLHVPVDLRADPRYQPHSADCADQVDHATAVDVGERCVSDFLWQRHPWCLYAGGDARRTEPGVDYLVAYWLGRRHGWLADDGAGRCAVFR